MEAETMVEVLAEEDNPGKICLDDAKEADDAEYTAKNDVVDECLNTRRHEEESIKEWSSEENRTLPQDVAYMVLVEETPLQ